MIPNIKILVLLFLCTACYKEKPFESETNELFYTLYESNINKNIPFHVIDNMTNFPDDFFFKNDSISFLDDYGYFFEVHDKKCFSVQQEKMKRNEKKMFWSMLGIKKKYELLNMDSISTHKPFSTKWWKDYMTLYNSYELVQFSYPIFTCKKDVAIFNSYHYSLKNGEIKNREILILKKDSSGIWKYSGEGIIITNNDAH